MQSVASCAQISKAIVRPSEPALYEAPVSLNTYLDVPGLGRVQCTGRGTTAREAVQHLLCATEELRAQTAPQAPPAPTKPTLGELLACGLERATARQDWALCERLAKAAVLVCSGSIEPTDCATVMAVRSATNRESWYEVTGTRETGYVCTCRDWQKHHEAGEAGYTCKHGLGLALWSKLNA